MVLSACGDKHGRAGARQGRVARANTRPLDPLAIYKILGENRGTYISSNKNINFLKNYFHYRTY